MPFSFSNCDPWSLLTGVVGSQAIRFRSILHSFKYCTDVEGAAGNFLLPFGKDLADSQRLILWRIQ